MSDELVHVPLTDPTVRRLFGEPRFAATKRGYDPDQVGRFLDELGERTVALIERLQTAEKAAADAEVELDDYRLRAEQAESSRGLFERTLVLAEETANASVADAKARAERMEAEADQASRRMVEEARLQVERMMDSVRVEADQLYADERVAIGEAKARIENESAQLETLRLAVAAESMALEEVRNELRRRIRQAATHLLGVAESPDCLGTPVTRGIPEVVARQNRIDQESALPEDTIPQIDPSITAAGRAELAPAPEPAEAAPAAVESSAPEATSAPTDSAPPPPPPPPPPDTEATGETDPTADDTPKIDLSAHETEGQAPADPPVAEPDEATPVPAATDPADAFERFMSDEIEDEPSRKWILA